jgi:hypothetical protein
VISADLSSRRDAGSRAALPGNERLITRRSQVQILPPLLERPRKRGLSVLSGGIEATSFCPTFATRDAQARGWTRAAERFPAAPVQHGVLLPPWLAAEFGPDDFVCARTDLQACVRSPRRAVVAPCSRPRRWSAGGKEVATRFGSARELSPQFDHVLVASNGKRRLVPHADLKADSLRMGVAH